jgi:hypothetical protein
LNSERNSLALVTRGALGKNLQRRIDALRLVWKGRSLSNFELHDKVDVGASVDCRPSRRNVVQMEAPPLLYLSCPRLRYILKLVPMLRARRASRDTARSNSMNIRLCWRFYYGFPTRKATKY